MTRLSILIVILSLGLVLICCDRLNKTKTRPDPVFMAMKSEAEMYISATKKMKTEYEVLKYIDVNTKYLRKQYVDEAGSEDNWKTKLKWIEKNGGKIVGYFDNGGPLFDRVPGDAPFEKKFLK